MASLILWETQPEVWTEHYRLCRSREQFAHGAPELFTRTEGGWGIATAVTRLLVEFGVGEAGYHRRRIAMSVENTASRRVAEKAGVHHEGITRGLLLLGGRFHDAHAYRIVAESASR